MAGPSQRSARTGGPRPSFACDPRSVTASADEAAESTFARLLPQHAPDSYAPDIALRASRGEPFEMIVVAADIRKSTLAMSQAKDPQAFALTIGNFVSASRQIIGERGGWFDKFTGDGFLAYWIADTAGSDQYLAALSHALQVSDRAINAFNESIVPALRNSSRYHSRAVGLSIGIDSGEAHLVKIADELTIVGGTVVGAVRMVSAAGSSQVVLNVSPGQHVARNREALLPRSASFEMVEVTTKEYDRVDAYRIEFGSTLHGTRLP